MIKAERKNKRIAVIYWIITLSYMGIIFYITSRGVLLPKIPQNFDKIVHLVIYLFLALLFYFSFKKSGVRRYIFLLSFVLAAIYGIIDEFHQFYVPGRETSIGDIIADLIGAFLGSYAANIFSARRI